MTNKTFGFVKNLRIPLIIYAVVICAALIVGIVFGVGLDINFKGGSRLTYTYTGEIKTADAEKIIEKALDGKDVSVSESSSMSGDTTKLVVTLVGDEALSTEAQQKILTELQKEYKDNNVALGEAQTVNPTLAGSFFAKALFAVALAAALVVVYVGIRFRRIGGVSAGITALAALVLDVAVAFSACILFRLQIDSNFMAVILTLLGYSLNDTIVIYDRIRENKKSISGGDLATIVDTSITQVMRRTIFTTITTFVAVLTVIVVSEICGLTSLRTFAIPMAFGIVSGCVSSMCVSGPLWVKWCNYAAAHTKKDKKKNNKKKKK